MDQAGSLGKLEVLARWGNAARGLADTLRTLQARPYGPYLLGMVTLGLVAFGTYSSSEAGYRRIDLRSASTRRRPPGPPPVRSNTEVPTWSMPTRC